MQLCLINDPARDSHPASSGLAIHHGRLRPRFH